MTATKTKTTGAKKATKAKPKLAVFEADKAGTPTTQKQQAAAEASAKKLARLEASDTAEAPVTKSDDKEAKPAATRKAKAAKPERMSALDAAAKVLQEAGEPMNAKAMIDAMSAKGYWTSPGGKTPQATLYSAILRELAVKGKEARFKKTERGHFAAA